MAISAGEIEATMRLKDELSGGLAKMFGEVEHYAKQFASTLGKIEEGASGFGKGGEIIATALGAIPLAAVAAVAGIVAVGLELGHLAMEAAAVGEELKDMSYKTGMSVPGLSNLKFAAEAAGSNIGSVSNAIFMMQKRMADNPDAFEKGLKKIGLNMDEVKKLKGEEFFLSIARGIRENTDESNRAAASFELMGRQGRDMLPLMMEPLDELIKKSKELGFTWTDEDAEAAKKLAIESRILGLEWDKIWVDIGKKAMPALSALYRSMQNQYEQLTGETSMWGDLKRAINEASAAWDLFTGNHGGAPKLPPSAMPIGAGPKDPTLQDNELEGVIKRSDEAMRKLEEHRKKFEAERLKGIAEGEKLRIKTVKEAWDLQQKILDGEGKREYDQIVKDYKDQQDALAYNIKVDDQMRADAWRAKADMQDANGMREYAEVIKTYNLTEAYGKQSLQHTADEAKKNYDIMVAHSGDFNKTTIKHFKGVAEEAQRLALGLDKSLGSDLMNNFKAIPGMVAQAFTGGGGLVGAVKGIGSMLSSTLGEHLGKAIKSLGDMGGPIGAAVGSLAGPLIEMFAKMLDHTGKDIRRVGAELGVKLSDGLVDQIKKDSKNFGGEMQGMLLNLDKVIGEAGGVAAFGIDKAIAKTRDLFVMLETGQLKVKDVGSEFDKVFAQIAPDAVDKFTGLAKPEFLELIDLAHKFGVESKTAMAFLVGQSANVASGFSAVATGWASVFNNQMDKANAADTAIEKLTNTQTKLKAQIDDMNNNGGPGNEKQRANLELWKNQLLTVTYQIKLLKEEQKNADTVITAAMQNGQDGFDRMGRLAVVAFESIIATGGSLLDALKAIGPGLDQLSTAADTFGFTASGAFKELMNIRKFADAQPEVVASIDGLNKMMSGLYNLGLLTQGTFSDLAKTATETFQKMVDGGLTSDQALAMMQPTLQTIWELQKRNGFVVDENTQKLIDQAVEAGVVGDAHRSAADKMVIALDKVVTVLEAMATFMGVTLPQAAKDGAKGVSDAFDAAHPHINVKVDYSDPNVQDNTIGMAKGGAGRTKGPTWFYSAGNEDFAFSGEGSAFSGGGGDNSDLGDRVDGLQESIDGLRRDFTFTIPNQLAKAVAVAFVKAGR